MTLQLALGFSLQLSEHANTLPTHCHHPHQQAPRMFSVLQQTSDRTSNHRENLAGSPTALSTCGFSRTQQFSNVSANGIGQPSSSCQSYCMWRPEAAVRHSCLQLFVLAVLLAGCAANPQGAWLPNQGRGPGPQPFCTQ